MKKLDFIADTNVQIVIEHLTKQKDIFKDQIANYKWPDSKSGKSYSETDELLNNYRDRLLNGIKVNNPEEVFEASKDILKWGGVLGSEKVGNLNRLISLKENLIATYNKANITWGKSSLENLKITDNDFPSNAGFTKIYSLILNDFIIYDSRVGAALAQYILEALGDNVPELLKIDIPAGRPTKNGINRRNPSPLFKTFTRDFDKHFKSNVKASWILQEVAQRTGLQIRELEAALFMLGYDVSKSL